MTSQKIIFAAHDATTYQNLKLIEQRLSDRYETEYLFLNDLFGETLPEATSDISNARHAINYIRHEWVSRLDHQTHPGPLRYEIIQQILYDVVSPHIPYNLRQYAADADPDLFVCAHDRIPFVKHLLKIFYKQNVTTVALQHGIRNIRGERNGPEPVNCLRPNSHPMSWTTERIKREVLYPYGAFILGNPYLDEIYTIGEFFTDIVRSVRDESPCFGSTDVLETGYPEYGHFDLQPYSPDVDSVLFLSTWEYEAGMWDDTLLNQVIRILASVRDENDVSVTVRPHPKDSAKKIDRYRTEFDISERDSMIDDIDLRDMAVTSFSTTILPSAIRGRVCGALRLPWERNQFGPFVDPFVLQIDEDHVSIHDRADQRTAEDQERFLKQYCFLPQYHHPEQYESPAAYIAERLTNLLETSRTVR
ncbi:hypothetical protein [Salinigranum salinum]|uniref:hypothetical protein n=1 Tax=Salinigranum salinum TaxID=1364937 RepID=UPI0012608AE8|nr:hypothetical protein [Salinigranum salinum]